MDAAQDVTYSDTRTRYPNLFTPEYTQVAARSLFETAETYDRDVFRYRLKKMNEELAAKGNAEVTVSKEVRFPYEEQTAIEKLSMELQGEQVIRIYIQPLAIELKKDVTFGKDLVERIRDFSQDETSPGKVIMPALREIKISVDVWETDGLHLGKSLCDFSEERWFYKKDGNLWALWERGDNHYEKIPVQTRKFFEFSHQETGNYMVELCPLSTGDVTIINWGPQELPFAFTQIHGNENLQKVISQATELPKTKFSTIKINY